jgi:Flp pilus assembly pilin Flp
MNDPQSLRSRLSPTEARFWALWRLLSRPFRGSARGATTIEYLVVTGLVSFVAIAGFTRFGKSLRKELKAEAGYIEGKGLPKAGDILGDLGGMPGAACDINGFCPKDSNLCFGAGTLVSTEAGDRPIESLKVGDLVWSRDEHTGRVELRPIERTFVTHQQSVIDLEVQSSFAASEHLSVTPSHRFWAGGRGWVAAAELAADPLWSPGGALTATPLSTQPALITVYNLEVAEFHTYFVGRSHVWVHNACPQTNPTTTPLQACLDTKLSNGTTIGSTANGTAHCNEYLSKVAACGSNQLCKQVEMAATKCIASGALKTRDACRNKFWGEVGEQMGAQKAEQQGLEQITSDPWREINPMGNTGIDDVRIDADGNVYIVEYKGNNADLNPGQMTQTWVDTKLREIENWLNARKNVQDGKYRQVEEIYNKILQAKAQDKLYGVLYKTKPDPNQTNTEAVATKGWTYGSSGGATTNCSFPGASSPPCP